MNGSAPTEVDLGKRRSAATEYVGQVRSFYAREGFYPFSYTVVPILLLLVDPPRVSTFPLHLDIPLRLAIGVMAALLHLPSYWVNSAQLRYLLAAQTVFVVLATMLIPAAVFLHLLPIAAAGRFVTRRDVVVFLGALIVVAGANWYLLFPHLWWIMYFLGGLFGWIGRYDVERERTNARLKLASAESKRLGASAERERIARDLHDLLGQSLSLISVKAELTKKLADRDIARALQENDDVIRIAKNTLNEVRQAVTSYRAPTLDEELATARLALRSVGAVLYTEMEPLELRSDLEATLALVLREAITNVVRHAGASWCKVTLRCEECCLTLEIRDNGSGGRKAEGSGLRGMRERVETTNGSFRRYEDGGTILEVAMPLDNSRRARLEYG